MKIRTLMHFHSKVINKYTSTSDHSSTPCSVRLTCSLCPTRQSIPNSTAVCSHSSFQSGSGIWTVADHSISGYSEVRADGCSCSVPFLKKLATKITIPYQHRKVLCSRFHQPDKSLLMNPSVGIQYHRCKWLYLGTLSH